MKSAPGTARPQVIALIGPTATGKTEYAIELARRFPLDIISVDSAMVYRGMDIGTAKPDASLLRVAPHRLIDICDPAEPYSAAMFRRDALHEIAASLRAGRIPLLVGGTMLYFRALERGLSGLPSADPDIRRRLEAEGRTHGWPALHARLTALDPVAGQRIHPNDPQRIQRALEIFELTGRPMSDLLGREKPEPFPFDLVKIHVMPDERGRLHRDIEQRFHQMLELGLLREVETLYRRGDLDTGLPAVRAVGYRQLWGHLEGKTDLTKAVERAITETRRLARRQMTWMRSETSDLCVEGHRLENSDRLLKFVASVTHYQS